MTSKAQKALALSAMVLAASFLGFSPAQAASAKSESNTMARLNPEAIKAVTKLDPQTVRAVSTMKPEALAAITKLSKNGALAKLSKNSMGKAKGAAVAKKAAATETKSTKKKFF